ncbi:MAG TPA: S1 RNA-binding domain-containing protein [Anaerolineales bacterium]
MEQNDALLGQGVAPESNLPAEDTNNNHINMETLLDQEGMSLDFPQPGEIRTGVVASISQSQILVSVGAKSEGVITGRELEAIPAEERAALQLGQEILVYVLSAEDSSGNVVLSYTRAQEQKGWTDVEKLLEEGGSFDGKVDGFNKGGIIVPVFGLRGFVPASQLGISRRMAVTGDTPDARYAKMIGEAITVRVIEVDRKRRRLILSERAASSETRQSIKERVIESLKEGEVYTGKVTSLADFGAFVNVNGADGLVHLSEISWERVQHPSEVLEVGQEVQVKIINIDREKKRIGLSIRALQNDPWQSKVDKFKVGQLVEGIITRLTKFGAFARLEGDLEGLIHISEISENRIEHPKEAGLHDGSVVTLRIIRIDPSQRRIGLSLRKVDSGAYKDLDLKQIDLEGVNLELVNKDPDVVVPVPARDQEQVDLESAKPELVDKDPDVVVPVPAWDQEQIDLEGVNLELVDKDPDVVVPVPARDLKQVDPESANPELVDKDPDVVVPVPAGSSRFPRGSPGSRTGDGARDQKQDDLESANPELADDKPSKDEEAPKE